VQSFLDETFSGMWLVAMVDRVLALDFCLWGYVKDYIDRNSVDGNTAFLQA
jgi:hypothetical protein